MSHYVPTKNAFRFFIEYHNTKSPVFRFWINGNDAYLSVRNFTEHMKVSFHESGVSLIGKGKTRWRLKERVLAKHDQRWQIVGAIDFPSLTTNPTRISKKAAHHQALSFRAAPIGHSVTFTIYCSEHQASEFPLTDVEDSIGPFRTRSGGTFWMVTNVTPLNEKELVLIKKYKNEATFESNEEALPGIESCLFWVSHGYPYAMIIVIPMDRSNFLEARK